MCDIACNFNAKAQRHSAAIRNQKGPKPQKRTRTYLTAKNAQIAKKGGDLTTETPRHGVFSRAMKTGNLNRSKRSKRSTTSGKPRCHTRSSLPIPLCYLRYLLFNFPLSSSVPLWFMSLSLRSLRSFVAIVFSAVCRGIIRCEFAQVVDYQRKKF